MKPEDKDKLRLIDTELAQLSLSFGEHVLADSQAFELYLTDKKQLDGLPETSIAQAEALAKEKNKDGWIFTLDYPSYVPFVTYADDRELRKKMSLAFGKKGFQDNENNNETVILKLIRLKKDRANLLGYSSHADFVLEERMAQSASQVNQFLDDLYQNALPFATKEWEQIERFASEKLDLTDLQKWDTSYVSEKLKQELFDFEQHAISDVTQVLFNKCFTLGLLKNVLLAEFLHDYQHSYFGFFFYVFCFLMLALVANTVHYNLNNFLYQVLSLFLRNVLF